ncbi:RNA-binding protein 41-like isoform X3 [Pomacea canaliculata]|uniref:RNA-binding protein 41-like isoform X3 n=1 Tax=Pomacea canaliculata TaxID=400727 RepID=UPI000D73E89A|nr:RNA-binding protein 41-like isoform X3 [Pomacea canaliculata]
MPRHIFHNVWSCSGNPKRLQTGQVISMSGVSPASWMTAGETFETEGERQLKAMAQRQLRKDITFNELLTQKHHFEKAGQYKPDTKEIRGIMSLGDYSSVADTDSCVEMLRQCGLKDDEIRLYLSKIRPTHNQNPQSTAMTINPAVKHERLQAIEAKISEKEALLTQANTFRGVQELSRQQLDLEKSLFRGTERKAAAIGGLLTKQKTPKSGVSSDPINCLPEMLADIEARAQEKIKQKRRHRKKNLKHVEPTVISDDISSGVSDSCSHGQDFVGCLTREETQALQQLSAKSSGINKISARDSQSVTVDEKLDRLKQQDVERNRQMPTLAVHEKTCTNQLQDNSAAENAKEKAHKPKVIERHIEFVPQDYIIENRLSEDEIRCLPKFENYEAGSPGNVLYVKNLCSRTCEADLVSLFGRYQKPDGPPIVYRLMTGRMRGQAFITFENVKTASDALTLVNGFKLHERPLIIQYGRRPNS